MYLIDSENHFAVLAVMLTIAAIGFMAEKYSIGRRLPGAVIVLALAVLLSNLKILPPSASLYNVIWDVFVPLAIALYLIKADLISIVSESGRVLVAFLLGAVGVVAGATIGGLALDLGPTTAKLAGVFSATYSGGSLNFAAVAEAVGFRDPTDLARAVAIDNLLGLLFFLSLSLAAGWTWFKNLYPWPPEPFEAAQSGADGPDYKLTPETIVTPLALASFVCLCGYALANLVNLGSYRILFVSLIMVFVATVFRSRLKRFSDSEHLATVMMYLFFITLGAGADVDAFLTTSPSLIGLVLLIFLFHLIVLLLGAKLFRFSYGEVIVSSAACIGGPPIAVAFAILFGWKRLTGAAIALGVFGYAIGNFIGIGVYKLVLALLS